MKIVVAPTAIIECARIAGLVQVPQDKQNPDVTTSFGIGEVIIDALNKGCTNFVIGLGGSATNDGGLGMLQALGMKALDYNGEPIDIYGKDLQHMQKVNFNEIDSRLSEIKIKIACDVDNPLCGKRGHQPFVDHKKGPQQSRSSIMIKL